MVILLSDKYNMIEKQEGMTFEELLVELKRLRRQIKNFKQVQSESNRLDAEYFYVRQLDNAAVDSHGKAKANLSIILDGFKNQKVPIFIDDFTSAVDAGIAEEIVFERGSEMFSVINVPYLETVLPSVMLRNAFDKINREKAE